MTLRRWFALVVLASLFLGASVWSWRRFSLPPPATPASPWFEDVTEAAGIDFVQDPGPTGTYFMPQIMGTGAALFDFNRDGRLDIYLLHGAGPDSTSTNRLYRQNADGTFTNVSRRSGLDVAGYNTGVTIGDVNNDGWPDVCLTQYGGVKLFINQGDGSFRDATTEAGLEHPFWATSAALVDYDRDGWLDLVVVNYLRYDPSIVCEMAGGRDFCHPRTFPGTVTKLYRNLSGGKGNKAQVHFKDVTRSSGLDSVAAPGLGVVCADFDGDGWPDILVANDGKPNHLWINQRQGTFKEEAVLHGVAYNVLGQAEANMGVALGDVDGDGLFDLFITHLTMESNTLWKQVKRGVFEDHTSASGLSRPSWRGTGFGAVLADFDLDGAPDAALVNGDIARPPGRRRDAPSFWSPYEQRNQLFANDGTGRFTDRSVLEPAFCGKPGVWRGLTCGDIDGDGALDLLATCVGGRARLFRNIAPHRGHWLSVQAYDPAHGGRPAYGAEIRIRAAGHTWLGGINPASSYLSSNDSRVHFGLGSAAQVESLEVLWPDGVRESFAGGAVDRPVILRRGEGKQTAWKREESR